MGKKLFLSLLIAMGHVNGMAHHPEVPFLDTIMATALPTRPVSPSQANLSDIHLSLITHFMNFKKNTFKISGSCCFLILFFIHIGFSATKASLVQTHVEQEVSGPEKEVVNSLLEAINAGNNVKTTNFVLAYMGKGMSGMPVEVHVQYFQELLGRTGGLLMDSITRNVNSDLTHLVVYCRDKHYAAAHSVYIQLSKELKIEGLDFGFTSMKRLRTKPLPAASLKNAVENFLNLIGNKDLFSGAVLVTKGKQVISSAAIGESSKTYHAKNNLKTKFNLASMNKMFTAVAIMQLAEAGELNLDDTLSKFLGPEWLPAKIAGQITLRHLLSHTSGLDNYLNREYFEASPHRFKRLEDFKVLVKKDTLRFKSGSSYRYSNNGMLLLGAVIAKVSRMDYDRYVYEHIFRPCGMNDTGAWSLEDPVENLATGYEKDATGYRSNMLKLGYRGGPAGGGYSTVADLHQFVTALLAGKLVSKKKLIAMTSDQSGRGYGFGFQVFEAKNSKVFGHTGGFPGVSTIANVYQDQGYAVIVLSNYDYVGHIVAHRLSELIDQHSIK
jgi:CubicO group peptidase (beta-lactamase class C family)